MSNLSGCPVSIQYVNLLIYLFQLRPAFNSSKYYFFQAHPTRGLSTVSAGMTVNHASLLVFTLLVSSLLVSKHCPWTPAVGGIPSHNWLQGSLHVNNGYVIAIPLKFWHAKISLWGFRTLQMKKSQIASISHYKTSSRRRLLKIRYDSQICLRRKNRGKIGLKSCSLNGP